MDINEIFKDLGMMIHEQGDVIGKSCWCVLGSRSKFPAVYLQQLFQARNHFLSVSLGSSEIKGIASTVCCEGLWVLGGDYTSRQLG